MFDREGLVWSDWFLWNGQKEEKWQIKNKQRNEYKEVTEEEWKKIEKEQDERRLNKYGG